MAERVLRHAEFTWVPMSAGNSGGAGMTRHTTARAAAGGAWRRAAAAENQAAAQQEVLETHARSTWRRRVRSSHIFTGRSRQRFGGAVKEIPTGLASRTTEFHEGLTGKAFNCPPGAPHCADVRIERLEYTATVTRLGSPRGGRAEQLRLPRPAPLPTGSSTRSPRRGGMTRRGRTYAAGCRSRRTPRGPRCTSRQGCRGRTMPRRPARLPGGVFRPSSRLPPLHIKEK